MAPGHLLGAHVSVAGGVARAIPRAAAVGCGAAQIFVKNASRWQAPPLAAGEAAAFRAARAASPVGPVAAHASYLINLAATDPTVRGRSVAALADELDRCALLGLDALVVHPGAHLGGGVEAGVERAAAALDLVLGAAAAGAPPILLENTAGQGSALGWRLEHLAAIRARVARPERVAVCLDTCHAFAAGYPLHEEAGYGEFVAELDEVVGLERVAWWHLNDSLRPFASRRDRHAHVGEGAIGRGLFARLLHDDRFAAVPMVVEIDPGEEGAAHRRDLAVLRGLLDAGAG